MVTSTLLNNAGRKSLPRSRFDAKLCEYMPVTGSNKLHWKTKEMDNSLNESLQVMM